MEESDLGQTNKTNKKSAKIQFLSGYICVKWLQNVTHKTQLELEVSAAILRNLKIGLCFTMVNSLYLGAVIANYSEGLWYNTKHLTALKFHLEIIMKQILTKIEFEISCKD